MCVPRALATAASIVAAGGTTSEAIDGAAAAVDSEPLARLEYVEVFDPLTLCPVDDLHAATAAPRVAIAVWFGDVRLIDNRSLS